MAQTSPMKRVFLPLAAFALAAPAIAQEKSASAPSPNEIVAAAPKADWVTIAPEDLLVMTLAPAEDGSARQVVIQLMPPPFSQGWIDNIRTLARAHWYDGISINRVQDNYVVQWGDPDGGEVDTAKPLPDGLKVVSEADYVITDVGLVTQLQEGFRRQKLGSASQAMLQAMGAKQPTLQGLWRNPAGDPDPYAAISGFIGGWPIGANLETSWPVHCYGMVGVARSSSPDTGSGADLYTVIGHAPRHLDRNIALVGRVIEGIEHLSSLPRGKGPLGFYRDGGKRVPIASVRVASDLPEAERPLFEYLDTGSETFARYIDARANRRDPFFIVPAGGADICNVPVPVRRFASVNAVAD